MRCRWAGVWTTWLLDLHDNLLYEETGRAVNGLGALMMTLLSLTGACIWWPGIQNWRRSLIIDWKANWRRLNWNLHSTIGFWSVAFVFMWGITGIYLSFPEPFMAVVNYLEPLDVSSVEPRLGDTILYWLAYLHFGRFAGWPTKLLWALLGLAPPIMFITGALMWWKRVLRPSGAAYLPGHAAVETARCLMRDFPLWRPLFILAAMFILVGGPQHPDGTLAEMLGHPAWVRAHSLLLAGFVALLVGLFFLPV